MAVQASADERNVNAESSFQARAGHMLLLGRDDAALIERPTLRAGSATAPASISETCLHSATSISSGTTSVPLRAESKTRRLLPLRERQPSSWLIG